MKEWLEIGCVAKDEPLATDLTGVEYSFTVGDLILLERKEDMKKRGLASPNDGNALALTFAHPVPEYQDDGADRPCRATLKEYNPYAELD